MTRLTPGFDLNSPTRVRVHTRRGHEGKRANSGCLLPSHAISFSLVDDVKDWASDWQRNGAVKVQCFAVCDIMSWSRETKTTARDPRQESRAASAGCSGSQAEKSKDCHLRRKRCLVLSHSGSRSHHQQSLSRFGRDFSTLNLRLERERERDWSGCSVSSSK